MSTKKNWNCLFTPRYVTITNKFLGPSVYGLKGKQAPKTKDPVQTEALVLIPKTIEENCMELTIAADVLHANQILFFSLILRCIHFGTISVLLFTKVNDLERALLGVIHSYSLCGFIVKYVLVDIQFECLKSRMSQHNVLVNVVSCDEHVPKIERCIWGIKERYPASIAMLFFNQFPRCLIVDLLKTVVFHINVFPWPSGASQVLGPLTIVEAFVLDYGVHFQAIFSDYAQAYEGVILSIAPKARLKSPLQLGITPPSKTGSLTQMTPSNPSSNLTPANLRKALTHLTSSDLAKHIRSLIRTYRQTPLYNNDRISSVSPKRQFTCIPPIIQY